MHLFAIVSVRICIHVSFHLLVLVHLFVGFSLPTDIGIDAAMDTTLPVLLYMAVISQSIIVQELATTGRATAFVK